MSDSQRRPFPVKRVLSIKKVTQSPKQQVLFLFGWFGGALSHATKPLPSCVSCFPWSERCRWRAPTLRSCVFPGQSAVSV